MPRKSLGWLWAGVGVLAVVLVIVAGVGRRAHVEVAEVAPGPMPPIIVEPIQPATASVPASVAPARLTVAAATAPSVDAAASASASTTAATTAALSTEGAERIRQIQQALHGAGLDPGPIDGRLGQRTQRAIREFQQTNGLSVDGKVGPKTWTKLQPYLHASTASSAATASSATTTQSE